MGNQWLIKLMLFTPLGINTADAVKGKTGLGFQGVKTPNSQQADLLHTVAYLDWKKQNV